MDIYYQQKNDVAVFNLCGRLDVNGIGSIREQLKAVNSENRKKLHVNMHGVEFIDSAGLGGLLMIMKDVRVQKGRMTFSDLSGYVKDVFELTRLLYVFEVYPTEESALNSYAAMDITVH